MKKISLSVGSILLALFIINGLLIAKGSGSDKISPKVDHFLHSTGESQAKVWIYFTDHGGADALSVESALSRVRLSDRAEKRRKNRSRGALVDVHDLPVSTEYIEWVKDLGCRVRHSSKYFNAISAFATREQINTLSRLPFVKHIDRVATFRRAPRPVTAIHDMRGDAEDLQHRPDNATSPALYGPSYKQLDQINVIPLHDANVNGEGVLIAMLDTGYNQRHLSFRQMDVIAQYDFVFNDSIVENEAEDHPSQHNHGTYTLSAIGGYAEGELIGPAWGASYALAKTERVFEEVQAEEDDYVRGLEWADSLGAEVVSSSLGYYDWYTYADLDGNTAVTTKASDIAASKGMTIVTAAGNEGPLPWPGIIAPSDGDSVFAIGAVDSFGVIAGFSSRGPSYDGRIKPDVCAQGVSVVCAAPWDSLTFYRVGGTSLSTPLVAGACALLLQMHPHWTPIDVMNALRNSASQSSSPDNDYGWGIINAYVAALNGSTGVAAAYIDYQVMNGSVQLSLFIPSPPQEGMDLLRRHRLSQEEAWSPYTIVEEDFMVDPHEPYVIVDKGLPGGVYQYRVQIHNNNLMYKDLGPVIVPFAFTLGQNYPNPFVSGGGVNTTIPFSLGGSPSLSADNLPLSSYREVSLTIYDVKGARVKHLVDDLLSPQEYRFEWDGRDEQGSPVASGVYYYRLKVDGQSLSKKIVVITR